MPPIHSFLSNGMPMKRKKLPCFEEVKKDTDPKFDKDVNPGLLVPQKKKMLPRYKPILKWVKREKWKNPEEIRDYLKDIVSTPITEKLVVDGT
ncbi:hypothetical protein CDL15_Pgr005162 [Punica granatum]|uniref:Uncharacterized protein n=1 Tax=Punica granatum TaxID=22663 RepID=A0A218WRI9_PUNGR|nr:hypothetical protein CDL15_Pgr005162 [Punica granatum]